MNNKLLLIYWQIFWNITHICWKLHDEPRTVRVPCPFQIRLLSCSNWGPLAIWREILNIFPFAKYSVRPSPTFSFGKLSTHLHIHTRTHTHTHTHTHTDMYIYTHTSVQRLSAIAGTVNKVYVKMCKSDTWTPLTLLHYIALFGHCQLISSAIFVQLYFNIMTPLALLLHCVQLHDSPAAQPEIAYWIQRTLVLLWSKSWCIIVSWLNMHLIRWHTSAKVIYFHFCICSPCHFSIFLLESMSGTALLCWYIKYIFVLEIWSSPE